MLVFVLLIISFLFFPFNFLFSHLFIYPILIISIPPPTNITITHRLDIEATCHISTVFNASITGVFLFNRSSAHGTAGSPTAVAIPTVSIPSIPVRALLPWLLFAALLVVVAMYFVSAEQGATSLISGTGVHEWVHDGRHLLGFPCH